MVKNKKRKSKYNYVMPKYGRGIEKDICDYIFKEFYVGFESRGTAKGMETAFNSMLRLIEVDNIRHTLVRELLSGIKDFNKKLEIQRKKDYRN